MRIFAPKGCANCTDGYKGRVGIYQVMPVTDAIARLILAGGHKGLSAAGSVIHGFAAFVVDASSQNPANLASLRTGAAGRFLNAAAPGKYQVPAAIAAPSIQTRKINKSEVGN